MSDQTQPTLVPRAVAALTELHTLLTSPPPEASCHVFLYSERGRSRTDKWRRLRFTSGLATEFRVDLAQHLLTKLPPHKEVVAFSFDEMVGRHIGVIEKAEIAEIASWFDDVPSPSWAHTFNGDHSFFSRVKFHATAIAADGHTRTLKVFKQRSSSSLLHRGGHAAIFSTSRHEFSAVSGAVFDFSLDCDFFEWDGMIFILHLPSFESLTSIRQITLTRAHDAISAVKLVEHLEVVGLDDVAMRLKDRPSLAKKLAAAQRQGTIGALRAETLLDRIEQKKLPLSVEVKGNSCRIIVDTNVTNQVNEFINLVTDVYLLSPVTSKEYKVHAKEPA